MGIPQLIKMLVKILSIFPIAIIVGGVECNPSCSTTEPLVKNKANRSTKFRFSPEEDAIEDTHTNFACTVSSPTLKIFEKATCWDKPSCTGGQENIGNLRHQMRSRLNSTELPKLGEVSSGGWLL
jgi:hypothetical protein